jgi:hypothetical protein
MHKFAQIREKNIFENEKKMKNFFFIISFSCFGRGAELK